jgi:hypothetical protein
MKKRVVILEESPGAALRLARAATVASDMVEAVVVGSVAEAEAAQPAALGYGALHADAVASSSTLRGLPAVVWTQELSSDLFQRAAGPGGDVIVAVVAWPTFATAPRAWEALLAFRMALASSPSSPSSLPVSWPSSSDLVTFGASVRDWRLVSSSELADVVEQVGRLAQPVAGRQAERIAATTHELLMNALYDAPMTPDGQYRFAHDRRAQVELAPAEAVSCRVACDGSALIVEVVDPFGSLRRSVAFRSVARGIAAARIQEAAAALDTSHGGAGLGLHRVFSSAAATLFSVVRRRQTRVAAVFDLTLAARDLRGMPHSLHFTVKDP